MNDQNTQQLKELCAKIVGERDPQKFAALVQELDQLLEDQQKQPPTPPGQ